MSELLGGTFGIFIFVFLFVLALLWFLLPFAVFGIKDKLELLIAETKKTNALLDQISREGRRL